MEVSETNELKVPERNNRNPIRILASTVLKYLVMYILIPLSFFPFLLSYFSINDGAPQFAVKFDAWFWTLVVYLFYKKLLDSVFYANGISVKKEWINYLTLKKLKIRYYKKIMRYLEMLDLFSKYFLIFFDNVLEIIRRVYPVFLVVIFLFVWFLVCAGIWLPYHEKIFGLSIGKSLSSLISVPNFSLDLINVLFFFFVPFIIATFTLFILIIIITFTVFTPIRFIFPTKNGIIDASDIPISFIEDAIEKLEVFDFSCSLEKKRDKKKQIIDSISYASEHFINVNKPSQAVYSTNICYILAIDQFNKSVLKDILFRTNGLYQKIEKLCVKINNMNTPEEQNEILRDLNMYLKVIEDRDLSEIDLVEYEIKKSDLTSSVLKAAAFLYKIL